MISEITNKNIFTLRGQIKGFQMVRKLNENQRIFIIYMDQIVSMIFITIFDNMIEISYVYTNDNFRKRGFASMLVKHIMELSKTLDVKIIKASILPNSESLYVFKKNGFKIRNNIAELNLS
ncbi:acetyltransferase GNAT domain protein [Catovirus CTV1]|uniref:Acetyltransferase GNAT domain protein n=1 Tax=Catovirus CTV1 TaxID=1977631 RepID=A0A1V0SBM9_9VIRU|nr:acetyltransferase GNAT domain protein [Catovirus CTV1]